MQLPRTPHRAQNPDEQRRNRTKDRRRQRRHPISQKVHTGTLIATDLAVVVAPLAKHIVAHQRSDLLQDRRNDERDEAGLRCRLQIAEIHLALDAALLRVFLRGSVGRGMGGEVVVDHRLTVGLAAGEGLAHVLELLFQEVCGGLDSSVATVPLGGVRGRGRPRDERRRHARRHGGSDVAMSLTARSQNSIPSHACRKRGNKTYMSLWSSHCGLLTSSA